MHNPVLIKTFVAGGPVAANHLVKLTGDETVVGTGDGDVAIGAVELDADEGENVDVVLMGVAEVQTSGEVRAGQPVCAGHNGCIKQAGPNAPAFGYALETADNDECVGVLISHHYLPAPQDPPAHQD